MNCQAVAEAEKNMVFAARLTQQGHKIASMDDLMELYEKSFSVQTVAAMGALPHPTIQKFAVITVAIVGASRRFLAQITRHQNEVKFMSASLQYSNYTGQADFAVPYSIMTAPAVVRELYLKSCHESMKCYEALCTAGSGHDAAGYATPQGLRNVLLISATPYQWKHIISQRVCRRNTDETVVLLSHKKPDSYIHIDVEFGEGEGKIPVDKIVQRAEQYKPKERVTYKRIKEYILEKYGFKVHTAYIAEVKRSLGLPMYDAPNAVEKLKQARKHPTPEKVEAIKDALHYFAVI